MTRFGKHSIDELQSGINRLFEQVWHGGLRTGPFDGQDWAPPVELREAGDRFVVLVEIPGLELADIEVIAQGNRLTIGGQKAPTPPDDTTVLGSERRFGSFCRTVTLDEPIHADGVSASLQHGVLTVTARKKVVAQSPAIRIQVSDDDKPASRPVGTND